MQEALLEELKCPVCLELLENPVLLCCPHSVCRKCATKLMEFQRSSAAKSDAAAVAQIFLCPLCEEATPTPCGVASLKKNVHLHNVVEQLRQHGPSPSAMVLCGRCEKSTIVSGCKTCGVLYCTPCRTEVHIGAFAHHIFTDADTFQRSMHCAEMTCEEHNEALKLYCPKCIQLVCFACGMFGDHKDHGCKLLDVEHMEEVLHAVTPETNRLLEVLEKAQVEVEADGRDSETACQKLFDGFMVAIRENTKQRLALVNQQRTVIEELQQHARELLEKIPLAKNQLSERQRLHCLLSTMTEEMQQLVLTTPPLLQLGARKDDSSQPSSGEALGVVLPPLPAPTTGEAHSCQLCVAYPDPFPQFQPDPPITGLHFSCQNRRCRRVANSNSYLCAVAKQGFASGQRQFTVRVINPGPFLYVGVAIAEAPRSGSPYPHGVFLNHKSGHIFTLDAVEHPYASPDRYSAGCHITMRLDFTKKAASYEVDGQNLGAVPCPLPPGRLFPAVLFRADGEEVEFVPFLAP